MSSKYKLECIITNCADLFCLVCECYLLSEEHADKHVNKPVHKKTLALTRYFESYEEDRIRQVPRGYYCEYCSIFICTSPKVGLHVADKSHTNNKGMCQLKRINNNLIYNDLLIPEDHWHSLKDNSCSVCDANFHCRNLHKSNPSHILNLMQKKIEFGPRNFIYRMINENTLQCLTCNTISTLKYIDLHIEDLFHIENLKKCNKYYLSLLNNNEIQKNTLNKSLVNDIIDSNAKMNKHTGNPSDNTNITEKNNYIWQDNDSEANDSDIPTSDQPTNMKLTRENNKEKILDSVIYFAKNEININFETEMGYCKKCSKNIAFDFDLINEHVEKDKQSNKQRKVRDYVPYACDVNITRFRLAKDNNVMQFDEKESRSEKNNNVCLDEEKFTMNSDSALNNTAINATGPNQDIDDMTAYAQENHLLYNKNNKSAYCRVCEIRIPASSLKSMKEHVNGMRHKKNMLRKQAREKSSTMSLKRFIDKIVFKTVKILYIINMVEYVFINQKYCLSGESFNLIIKSRSNKRCFLCEETVDGPTKIYEHSKSDDHIKTLMEVHVVISLKDEFVREIGRGLYHCGFCNLILSNWEELQQHLQCADHINEKSRANIILIEHKIETEAALI